MAARICYEHGRDINMTFSSYDHVEEISGKVMQGHVHIPKESMVIAYGTNSLNGNGHIVAALSTCSKSETEFQANLLKTLCCDFAKMNGAPFLNISSDGAVARRQVFNSLMLNDLPSDSPIYPTISSLRLMDIKVGPNEETVNYDAKHLSKRTRGTLIGENLNMGEGRSLMKSDLVKILELAPNNSPHSIHSLVNPKDKQSVPLATQLLLLFSEAVADTDKLKQLSFRMADFSNELHLFRYVIDGILCLYTDIKTSIKEQLEKVSLAAHVLLILKITNKNVLPNQLYHDLQATFEDTFFVQLNGRCIMKIYHYISCSAATMCLNVYLVTSE